MEVRVLSFSRDREFSPLHMILMGSGSHPHSYIGTIESSESPWGVQHVGHTDEHSPLSSAVLLFS